MVYDELPETYGIGYYFYDTSVRIFYLLFQMVQYRILVAPGLHLL